MAEAGATDWEALYQAGQMQWEKGAPSPGLVDFLEQHPKLRKGTVCIPGCGTGHDVRAWANAGFQAHGFDVAPSAIRLSRAKTPAGLVRAHFHLGNFLVDPPPRRFEWLFEHTLFCAIQPSQRDDYIEAACRWLRKGGQLLAVYYLIPDKVGPPFGTTRQEIKKRFSPHFEMIESWVPRSYPNRTKLEWMVWWKKREASSRD